MTYEEIAENLRNNECLKHWRLLWLVVWLRDGCRCVYCGKDMIECYETTYYTYAHDHLLPKSDYPELESTEWNLVLSCSACNTIKSTFDPNRYTSDGSEQTPIYQQGQAPTEPDRAVLLQRARDYIALQKRPYRGRFENERCCYKPLTSYSTILTVRRLYRQAFKSHLRFMSRQLH